jgi:hypothetical protein
MQQSFDREFGTENALKFLKSGLKDRVKLGIKHARGIDPR